MVLILFQGISGLFGGTALVIDPTGELLQMPLSMLEGSPFRDFRIPGIILLTILGIIPTIVFYGLWKRSSWAWMGALTVSAALIIWIGVEIWMVGYHSEPPLQLVYGLLGLILLLLTLLPSVRHNFQEPSKRE
ncbi:hypothetical protein CWD77_00805 [Rhodohalobacter barkolensis]|uniref:Uncharacterized protein n=2 Tax=Rhodohalobacter barkolensis TaxID=2053187 RepID=A0A2N0VIM6_9BACT|nr:hypothetical protein CWD77_00805 [Rhodohalobacter barkolensis]